MSSLSKDPRGWSKYWVCCYTAADGRQLKRSTRETDKRKARTICEVWERAESLGRDGLLTTEAQFQRVLEEGFERISGKKVVNLTVKEWLDRWIKGESGAVADSTLKRYQQIIDSFLAFLGTRAEVRLEAVSTEDFTRFRDQLLEQGRAPRTVNIIVRKILKRPFTAAVNEGLLARNPISSIRHLLDVSVEKGTFTPEQIAQLVEAADADWKGLIMAGYFTGARLGDLARLTWASVDVAERSITLRQKKTGAKIKVPLHSALEDYLRSRSIPADKRKPLFPTLYKKPGPGKSGLSMSFKRLMARCGIDDGIARQKTGAAGRNVSSLSFHSLRHSFTSALANAGVTPELRQKLTGHLDKKSHAVYSHHELETIRDAVEKISALPKKTP
jgi:integrase